MGEEGWRESGRKGRECEVAGRTGGRSREVDPVPGGPHADEVDALPSQQRGLASWPNSARQSSRTSGLRAPDTLKTQARKVKDSNRWAGARLSLRGNVLCPLVTC
jgi:hypothetical protein